MEKNQVYLNVVTDRFKSVKALGDKTIEQLGDEEMHWQYNEASNSIAIIVKHMSGNMISRWTDIFTTDGEKGDRDRDGEFMDTLNTKTEIEAAWEKGWQVLLDTLNDLPEEDLLKAIKIRGEDHTLLEAIERQMSHYSYHVGQMVFIGKQIKGENWQSLSIPKGKSEEYSRGMLEE